MGRHKKSVVRDIKNSFKYPIEVLGIIMIILAILAFLNNSLVGSFLTKGAILLAGWWHFLFDIIIFITGVFLLIQRKLPKFLSRSLFGVYLILISFLVLTQVSFMEVQNIENVNIFKDTYAFLKDSFIDPSILASGGFIGAGFTWIFVKLFAFTGAKILAYALCLFGILVITQLSLGELIKGIFKGLKRWFIKDKEVTEENAEEVIEEVDENGQKIVISNIDDLKEYGETPKPEKSVTAIEEAPNSDYQLPPLTMLELPKKVSDFEAQNNIKSTTNILEKALADFGVVAKVVDHHVGPSATQFEIELKAGTKLTKVSGINNELALALAVKKVKIEAPIPGKGTVGIEIPNKVNAMVTLREILQNTPKELESNRLTVALGKNIMGKTIFAEINKTPHLLVAGATGSGKSVCINGMIISILMRTKPDEVKLVMIDPKKVELSMYNGCPHLLSPVVTDPRKASIALKKIVDEMERRYVLFSDSHTKNIETYNAYVDKKNFSFKVGEPLKRLPYIVVLIDELADLMSVAAKEVEDSILRITQMARASGIHLIVATQRPSTEVITGLIKANIPSRIAFAVSSSIDSRTILDAMGAESLLGKGDMLFMPQGESQAIRLQGAYVSDDEIQKVVEWTVNQQKAKYDESLTILDTSNYGKDEKFEEEYEDPLYDEAVQLVVKTGKASASFLQRKYHLGYNRAARIIELLEERGIVGPQNGSKPREILVALEDKDEE